jgi:hypothetical protein
MNPDNEGAYDTKTLVCHSCRAVEQEQQKQQNAGADMSGRRIIAILRKGAGWLNARSKPGS